MKKVVPTEEYVPGSVLMKDPLESSDVEFKGWLECHGVKVIGKKQELIDRVRGC